MNAPEALEGRGGSRIGDVWGDRYEILRQLSMGGMGTVYEARHVVVGRHFAIKVLHPECANRPRLVKRFRQEAKAVGSLASEHIVAVLDFGEHSGTPYFVMELLQGQDLRELLSASGALPVPRAVGIALDVCKGLRLAHAAGLIHRDLKPANIFVARTSEGRELAKVLDFGVAKLLDASASTAEGTLIGTLGYMALCRSATTALALGVPCHRRTPVRPPYATAGSAAASRDRARRLVLARPGTSASAPLRSQSPRRSTRGRTLAATAPRHTARERRRWERRTASCRPPCQRC
ncbi:MAG: hypothetical protein RL685_107 [Pseudomonadota bacterium]|jgi:tRNA A-37 threonylcarbamoyl transferase component Bud32